MKPILFNTEMVRALLEGRKTVTRRVMKPQPPSNIPRNYLLVPRYRPGDIMYVREAFWQSPNGEYTYKSDYNQAERLTWHPSIHMPREAARIFLRVTGVRVERLQEITEKQAQAEGVKGWMVATDRDWDKNPNHLIAFRHLWDSTIKPADRALYGWEANPYVWVIEFERCEKPEGD